MSLFNQLSIQNNIPTVLIEIIQSYYYPEYKLAYNEFVFCFTRNDNFLRCELCYKNRLLYVCSESESVNTPVFASCFKCRKLYYRDNKIRRLRLINENAFCYKNIYDNVIESLGRLFRRWYLREIYNYGGGYIDIMVLLNDAKNF